MSNEGPIARRRWIKVATIMGIIGAIAWLAKVCVILAIEGEQTDTGLPGLLFTVGFIGLAIGSTAIGASLAAGRRRRVTLLAASVSPLVVMLLFVAMQASLLTLLDGLEPHYVRDEIGVVIAAGLAVALGVRGLRIRAHPRRSDSLVGDDAARGNGIWS